MAGVWVSIVSTPSEYIVSTPSEKLRSTPSDAFGSTSASLGCVRSDFEYRSTSGNAKQIDIQYGIWIVYKKWTGNGLRILGRCRQTHTKPLVSAAVGPVQSAGYLICDSLERPAVAIGP
jgi:hypothetical protein